MVKYLVVLLLLFLSSRAPRRFRQMLWSDWRRGAAANDILDASAGADQVLYYINYNPNIDSSGDHWVFVFGDEQEKSPKLGIGPWLEDQASLFLIVFGRRRNAPDSDGLNFSLTSSQLEEHAGRRLPSRAKQLRSAMATIAVLLLLMGVTAIGWQFLRPDPFVESDAFHAQLKDKQIPPDQVPIEWAKEDARLLQVEPQIRQEADGFLLYKFCHRRALAIVARSRPKGSKQADNLFAEAQSILDMIHDSQLGMPGYLETSATLTKDRADNKLLLGKKEEALELFQEALSFAQRSHYAGRLEEAEIRSRLSEIFFRDDRWRPAQKHARSAAEIMLAWMADPSFSKEALSRQYWILALSTSRLGEDAESNFARYLQFTGTNLSASNKLRCYRELALNLRDCGQQGWIEDKKTLNRFSRLPAGARTDAANAVDQKFFQTLHRAREFLERAKDVPHKSQEETALKIAIYGDLAASYAEVDSELPAADRTFREAIELGLKSPAIGSDSPVLIPVRESYATFLRKIGIIDKALEQELAVERLKALPKK